MAITPSLESAYPAMDPVPLDDSLTSPDLLIPNASELIPSGNAAPLAIVALGARGPGEPRELPLKTFAILYNT